MTFQIKRIYDAVEPSDGIRVLVDRLWPRGVKKTDARLDHWMKDVAPSAGLRVWFDHKANRFVEFSHRYKEELVKNPALGELRKLGDGNVVTLLYAAHDPKVNQAVVLQSVLRGKSA
jgi:uncharacterized protein YeaO (DUF488 family)